MARGNAVQLRRVTHASWLIPSVKFPEPLECSRGSDGTKGLRPEEVLARILQRPKCQAERFLVAQPTIEVLSRRWFVRGLPQGRRPVIASSCVFLRSADARTHDQIADRLPHSHSGWGGSPRRNTLTWHRVVGCWPTLPQPLLLETRLTLPPRPEKSRGGANPPVGRVVVGFQPQPMI